MIIFPGQVDIGILLLKVGKYEGLKEVCTMYYTSIRGAHMVPFKVAKHKVEVFPHSTWLEAVHGANMAGKKLLSDSYFRAYFKEEYQITRGREEERQGCPPLLASGTLKVIGESKDNPLRAGREPRCEFKGSLKTVEVRHGKGEIVPQGTMITCNHGFAADGTPLIALFNARTGNPIRSDEEMGEADSVLVKLNGKTHTYRLWSPNSSCLEAVGEYNKYTLETGSLMYIEIFGYIGFPILFNRGTFFLTVGPSERTPLLIEASETPKKQEPDK